MNDLALKINGTEVVDPTGFDAIPVSTIISFFISAFFIIGAIAAVVYMITGGIRWITSGGDAEQIAKARSTIVFSVVGLIVILISVFVVKYVSEMLGFPLIILSGDAGDAPPGMDGNGPI